MILLGLNVVMRMVMISVNFDVVKNGECEIFVLFRLGSMLLMFESMNFFIIGLMRKLLVLVMLRSVK